MFLRKLDSKRMRSPQVAVPVGTALLTTGLMILLCATVLRRETSGFLGFTDHADFARGCVVGLCLAMELTGCVVLFRSAACAKS